MNPIDVVRAKISQFSSFLKENPTPAGYVAPKIANMVSDTIRGTTSPIPTSFQQQPIQAVRNIAAETTGQVINAIPRIGTSMMRISPPGQLYTQAKGYKTPQLQQDIIKQRLNDVYNSFQGIGLATGGASNLFGGVVGVGLGGVSNVMNQKPFFTNTEQNFAQGVLQAAPLAPIGLINPLGRGILNGRYVGLPSQYTIPARATARALKEGFEGAFLGAIEPGEEKNTLKKIKDYALFGAITGAMTQMGGDLTSVMIDRIANSFKVNKDTVLAHIKKANLPVATNETGRDGKRVYRPAWQVYNSKMNIGKPTLNTSKSLQGKLYDVYKGKEFSFVRNPEKAPNVGNRFGQNIEPAGKYMNLMEEGQTYTPPGWETGKVKFNNPLVIDWGEGYQSGNNWKNVLSKQYGGKTGKALSDAIRKDGYDGIITLDKGKPSEVVSLVKPNVAQPPLTDVNTPENIKWFSGLQADMEKLKRSNFIESLPKDKSGKFTVDPEKELSKLLGNFNKKYGTNITREDFLSGNLPERNDLLLNRINPNIAPQPPVSDIPLPLNTQNQTKFVPSKTEKNLGMEGGATPIPLSQNKGVVGQPTGSDKKVSIGGTGVIPEEKIQSFEQQLASSELDDTLRKMYSSDEIGVFNRVKQMARAKGVQNGDVETLYKKNPKLLESAFQSVKEKEPNITSNDEAFQYIIDLPTAKDATIPKPPTESFGMGDMAYTAQATPKTLEKIRVRDIKAQERAAKAEFDAWQRQYREKTVPPSQRVKAVEQSIKSNTSSPVSKDPEALKDISGWQGYMRDVYRNFKAVYGNRFDEAKRIMLDPLDRSKGQYVDMTENWAKKLKTDIVDRFNIRKGSKESAAVQQYGEGILSDSDLVTQFGAKKAQEIKAADQWFRLAYDELINIVNAVRKRIYPNNPEKWVAKRQDYYRHFREMKEGLGALFNIFDTPSNISSTLAGISEGTKPKAKFLSIAQQRKGERTTYDAVGGFIDYIKQASYATHIDPHIERFRNLSKELGESTTESKNLNTFVSYLNRFADDLSGKTNAADRFAQEIIPGGRTTFRAINWLNNRVKSNAVIGNASSALSQIMNVPQGIADAGVPNSIKGIGRTLASIFVDNPAVKRSTFLRERYSDPFSKFDTGIINDVGKFAKWMTGVLDKVGSNVIWNSQYEKALKLGVKDAVKFADDATRSLVAGRGIGEVPLLQKARVMQLVAPFQLEVQNLWWVLKDMKDQKAFGKIATFFVVNHLMNKAIEGIRGSDVTFDPIQSMMDGYKSFQEEENKGKGLVKFAGRQAGEVLSNVPFGQTIASLYPEYGATIGDTKLPTRKDLFGKGNPVRQGSGLLAVEGLKDPLYKIIPPYGGAQIKKTIEGLLSVGQGFVGKKDAIKYPVEQSGENIVKGALFGKSALNETRAYYDENRRPLSEKQSQAYFASADKTGTYNKIIEDRKERAQIDKVKDFIRETGKEQIVGDKYIYYDEKTGDVNTINLSWTAPELKKTGSEALDKKLLSEYKSDINKRQSDIMKLWEAGKVDQSYVMEEYDRLEKLKAQFNKPKKITIKKVSTPTYKKTKGLKIKRASFGKLKAMPKKKYKFRRNL